MLSVRPWVEIIVIIVILVVLVVIRIVIIVKNSKMLRFLAGLVPQAYSMAYEDTN